MEHQLFSRILQVLAEIDKGRVNTRRTFQDEDIVQVFYWAVIHDRPVSWACDRTNWPLWWKKKLPSCSTMSRRLRTASVKKLLAAAEQCVTAPEHPGVFWRIDGKPLPIGGCSKDRQAGYGRAAGCKAKGYKIHAIVGAEGHIAAWRLAPMNTDERVMAARMLKTAAIQGYVAADANFDSNQLHAICDERGNLQLVTPRRYGKGHGTGHRKQTSGRLHSMELLENPDPKFGESLLRDRSAIERDFGNLSNWGGGLTCLPPWARTHRRVYRWVQAKIALTGLRHKIFTTTYDS